MTLCIELAKMCEESAGPVALLRGEVIVLTIGRCQDAIDGEEWQVIDWAGEWSGRRRTMFNSYAAAIQAYDLLGDDARQVIGPVVTRWRYQRMFPLGSSLAWTPAPLSAWRPPVRPVCLDYTPRSPHLVDLLPCP